eukprot:TRINITY_DN256_c0_g2_i6.p1 TRINITY_DN256_c0_g2~~TRINITY_DN256_c0_g2_i6.p1  ORF type:complete len:196 (+),score=14.31 TRINITY_DN256_c0_g2_i6:456-1043(+)
MLVNINKETPLPKITPTNQIFRRPGIKRYIFVIHQDVISTFFTEKLTCFERIIDSTNKSTSQFIIRYINKVSASSTIRTYTDTNGLSITSTTSIESTISSQFSELYCPFVRQVPAQFPSSIKPLPLMMQNSLAQLISNMSIPNRPRHICTSPTFDIPTNTNLIIRYIIFYKIDYNNNSKEGQIYHIIRPHSNFIV